MRCQNAHACRFLYFKYVLPAGPIATSKQKTMHNYEEMGSWKSAYVVDHAATPLEVLVAVARVEQLIDLSLPVFGTSTLQRQALSCLFTSDCQCRRIILMISRSLLAIASLARLRCHCTRCLHNHRVSTNKYVVYVRGSLRNVHSALQ